MYKDCRTCGKPFKIKPSQASKRHNCSKECQNEEQRTRLKGDANPNYKDGGEKICRCCGTVFRSHDSTRIYCSPRCYHTARPKTHRFKGHSKDKNHNELVRCLEKMGCQVLDMSMHGGGFPDILVLCRQVLMLVEIKNPETGYGKKGLNEQQQLFARWWKGGPIYVIRTIADCETLVQGDRESLAHIVEA